MRRKHSAKQKERALQGLSNAVLRSTRLQAVEKLLPLQSRYFYPQPHVLLKCILLISRISEDIFCSVQPSVHHFGILPDVPVSLASFYFLCLYEQNPYQSLRRAMKSSHNASNAVEKTCSLRMQTM